MFINYKVLIFTPTVGVRSRFLLFIKLCCCLPCLKMNLRSTIPTKLAHHYTTEVYKEVHTKHEFITSHFRQKALELRRFYPMPCPRNSLGARNESIATYRNKGSTDFLDFLFRRDLSKRYARRGLEDGKIKYFNHAFYNDSTNKNSFVLNLIAKKFEDCFEKRTLMARFTNPGQKFKRIRFYF